MQSGLILIIYSKFLIAYETLFLFNNNLATYPDAIILRNKLCYSLIKLC